MFDGVLLDTLIKLYFKILLFSNNFFGCVPTAHRRNRYESFSYFNEIVSMSPFVRDSLIAWHKGFVAFMFTLALANLPYFSFSPEIICFGSPIPFANFNTIFSFKYLTYKLWNCTSPGHICMERSWVYIFASKWYHYYTFMVHLSISFQLVHCSHNESERDLHDIRALICYRRSFKIFEVLLWLLKS